jgi:hypothetical protein
MSLPVLYSLGLLAVGILVADVPGQATARDRPITSPPGPTTNVPVLPRLRILPSDARPAGRILLGVEGDPERALQVERDTGAGNWEAAGLLPPRAGERWFEESPPARPAVFYRVVDPVGAAVVRQDFQALANTAYGWVPTPEVGEPWIIRGYAWVLPTQAHVRNGFLVDENPIRPITYLGQRLAVRPRRVEMVGVWRPARADGTVEPVFTIALCLPTDRVWYLDCVHVRFHRHAVVIDVIRDGRFDPARAARTLDQPLALDQPHHLAVESEQDRVSLWVDGRRALESVQAEFGRSAGPNVFWEIYADEGSPRTTGAIQSVAAFAPPASRLSGQ